MHRAQDACKPIRVSILLVWRRIKSLDLNRPKYDVTWDLLGHDEVEADIPLREVDRPARVAKQSCYVQLGEVIARLRCLSTES